MSCPRSTSSSGRAGRRSGRSGWQRDEADAAPGGADPRGVVPGVPDPDPPPQPATELAFFAQDDAGNLWNLGEYPEEWDSRRFAGAPSTWVSGHAGALGGIHVHARPVVGSPTYVEGEAPAIAFLDHARVAGLGAGACAPVGCFGDVLVVDEWDPLAQPADGHQLKHYAPGKGPVRVEPVGGEEQETLVMTEHHSLDAAALDRVREAALRLDARAYQFQPTIWSTTSPAARD